jgi:hypothetical protein
MLQGNQYFDSIRDLSKRKTLAIWVQRENLRAIKAAKVKLQKPQALAKPLSQTS